ncbi:protein associated with UVRAG as autophagy enhancer isoform X2 [Xiphias gladius]|uniref:protein associated with UVRAG as autophagy enhancer isoform X2 n=1 Tax=Xiphias gladius TaxID=8245 RepID=UPI001A99F580|nr:protein associated with UVRAG as autophagy enhancer isoform X2 [Xiphias gladius]
MGTCRGTSSSPCRSRCVSWRVDSPTESPTPVTTAPTATDGFSHPNHQSAGSGSIPLLLLSPPETGGGESTFSHQLPQPTFTTRTHELASVRSHPSQLNPRSSSDKATNRYDDRGEDDGGDEGRSGNPRPPEAENRSRRDPSLLHPEAERFLLPRSSPVISRRPLSWHGEETDTSTPPSRDSPSPASGSLSLDHLGRLTVASLEDLGSKPSSGRRSHRLQEEKKQRCVSVSSNLNHFLISLFHLPFSGQEGSAEERRRRHLTSCDGPHTPGVSTSSEHSKQRRCSGIPGFSADVFRTSCELEKENAHFIVVDMVLEVLEGVKWTLGFDQWTSTMDARAYRSSAEDSPTREHHEQGREANGHTQSGADGGGSKSRRSDKTSHRRTRSAYLCTNQHTQEEEATGNDGAERQPKTFSVLCADSGFEDCGGDTAPTPKDSLRNAERLAGRLVLDFKRSWFPSHGPRRGRQSLRSSLQELPGTGSVAVSGGSLEEEIRLRTRMRGSLSWAPPCFQIIFTVQPTLRSPSRLTRLKNTEYKYKAGRQKEGRDECLRCCSGWIGGCVRSHLTVGVFPPPDAVRYWPYNTSCVQAVGQRWSPVSAGYIKKLRYCEYLGRYFCHCCHGGSEAVIPARVLSCWDFGRYPVSDFSKQLLDSVWHQPLFDLSCLGKTVRSRVKELDKFRELQGKLLGIKKLLNACRLAGRAMTEFEQLPSHLIIERPHLFSMDDLLKVKRGQLAAQAREALNSAINHVENCELCLARGFICEFCREQDVIFPFQSDTCRRCPACKACFHKHCFVEKNCPKCARIQSRKKCPDGSMECGS